jgi:hypothetical protein
LVGTAELTSIIDPEQERKVANEIGKALWEEAETSLRPRGKLAINYISLMALGGLSPPPDLRQSLHRTLAPAA